MISEVEFFSSKIINSQDYHKQIITALAEIILPGGLVHYIKII
jgi:hypothetical protein